MALVTAKRLIKVFIVFLSDSAKRYHSARCIGYIRLKPEAKVFPLVYV
jgi:hypothetical protein